MRTSSASVAVRSTGHPSSGVARDTSGMSMLAILRRRADRAR
jgi:hypothetical protein